MRFVRSLGGGSSKSKSGSREESGDRNKCIGLRMGEGRIMRVKGTDGFVRFVSKG